MKQMTAGRWAAFLICGTAATGWSGPSAGNVTSNTVAYWPFDEGAELTDASGNSHTLTDTAVTFFRGAAVFDAARRSKLVMQQNLPFSAYSNLTVECFFSVQTNLAAGSYGFLLTSASTYGNAGTIDFYQQNGVGVSADFFNTSGNFDQSGCGNLNTAVWHHAAIVIDASKSGKDPDRLQLYIDRVRMSLQQTNTFHAALADNLLYIGARGTQDRDYFNGRIDDIRISSAVLTTNDFIRTRTAPTNCIAYWPFTPGNELADVSGNSNTLSNSRVVFTNGAALFSSALSSGLATLSALPLNDYPDVTVEFFYCATNSSSAYRFLLMSGETYGMPGSLSCYGEPNKNNLVSDFHDSAARYDSENTPLEVNFYDGKWHHVAYVLDSSKTGRNAERLRLYVDQVRQNVRNTNALDSALFDRILYIGKRGTGTDCFDGRMDDIRITGRALSTNEFLSAAARTASYGCIAYWPFKDGRELEDASGNGYTLVNSNVTFYGGSAVFDKNLSSGLATAAQIPFNEFINVTIEYFVRTTYVPPNLAYSFLTQSGPTYGQAGTFASYVTYNNDMLADITQTAGTVYNQERSNVGKLTDGQWHHVAYVMERSVSQTDTNNWFRLYVDGVRQTKAAAKCTQPLLNNNRFYMGARGTQGIDYFTGKMDDIRITGAALAPSAFLTRRTFYQGTLVTFK